MVAIEERVHPTPFRTRKLSSPSPMILHNVMWESRPLPKIVRDPLAALSARGSFFVPAPPGIFLFWGRDGLNYRQCSSLFLIPVLQQESSAWWESGRGCHLSRRTLCGKGGRRMPRDLKREKLAERETFLEKGSPSPRPFLPKTFAGGAVRGWKNLR